MGIPSRDPTFARRSLRSLRARRLSTTGLQLATTPFLHVTPTSTQTIATRPSCARIGARLVTAAMAVLVNSPTESRSFDRSSAMRSGRLRPALRGLKEVAPTVTDAATLVNSCLGLDLNLANLILDDILPNNGGHPPHIDLARIRRASKIDSEDDEIILKPSKYNEFFDNRKLVIFSPSYSHNTNNSTAGLRTRYSSASGLSATLQ